MADFYRAVFPGFDLARYFELEKRFEIDHSRPLRKLSRGMRAQAAIWLALSVRADVLLLDEPMGALDNFTRATLQDLLIDLQRANHTTMVLVTHDVDEAIYRSDRIVIMTARPGRVSEVVNVDFPRPRHRGGSEFLELRATLLEKFNLASAEPQPEYYI